MVMNHVSKSWDDPPSGEGTWGNFAKIVSPWKINMEQKNGDLVQILLLFSSMISRFNRHAVNSHGVFLDLTKLI